MNIVPPKSLTILSTDVPENLHAEYASATNYSLNDRVYVTLESDATTERTPHKIYESLGDNNQGNYPPDNPLSWLDIGATNRWKMLDNSVGSQTVQATSMTVTVQAKYVDTLALLNLQGDSVRVRLLDAADQVLSDDTHDLSVHESGSWSDYFFGDFVYRNSLVLPINGLYATVKIEVTLTGEQCTIGHLLAGRAIWLGGTRWDAWLGITDYSIKDTNDFGETYLTKRGYGNSLDVDVWIESGSVDRVHRTLADLRATPVLWQANNDETIYESLILFGWYRDFQQVLPGPKYSICSLNLEGLT
ncbi:MAG: hypothetical protein KZQ82_13930 [Candidatus Thiodiazotropha sp. (ex Lucinoma annulata)]|nr:hypothetical protein [Candidatus Thiodiazotropha sp. (ex Lucinoma annulata)]